LQSVGFRMSFSILYMPNTRTSLPLVFSSPAARLTRRLTFSPHPKCNSSLRLPRNQMSSNVGGKG
jgi:hypothetical protein